MLPTIDDVEGKDESIELEDSNEYNIGFRGGEDVEIEVE